jgi:hypothetical protein
MSTLATSRPARYALASISLAVLAMSCSAPRYEYVRNTSLRTAFKIPREWALYDRETLLGLPPGPQPSTPDPIRWLVGIDGDPHASVSHVLDPGTLNTDHPQGVALVQRFSFSDRDTSSYNALRNYLFPVDALLQDANSAQVLSYDDSIDNDGVRGLHIVFQFRASSLASAEATAAQTAGSASAAADLQRTLLGGAHAGLLSPDYVTVDQMAFVNADSSQVYFIAVLCSAACYQRNRSDISSIVDSWTVLP